MEDRLLKIVERIEKSSLSIEDKNSLYVRISRGLHEVVWPILVSHMPEDQLQQLSKEEGKATVDAYAQFFVTTASDEAIQEVNVAVNEILSDIDTALTQGGVA